MSTQTNPDTNPQDFSSPRTKMLLDQYKLFVATAEKVSDRRNNANKFYISLLSGILGIIAFILKLENGLDEHINHLIFIVSGLLGIILCFVWIVNLQSYKQLNEAKFNAAINKMEEELPFQPFSEEYKYLEEQKNFRSLSRVETIIPMLFMFPYGMLISYGAFLMFS
ncbi:MAG: hypothetical protein MRZ79_00100 [Bacteroidia bacterium]|nr:hypothetical protein [Bacteroidia bacterium]